MVSTLHDLIHTVLPQFLRPWYTTSCSICRSSVVCRICRSLPRRSSASSLAEVLLMPSHQPQNCGTLTPACWKRTDVASQSNRQPEILPVSFCTNKGMHEVYDTMAIFGVWDQKMGDDWCPYSRGCTAYDWARSGSLSRTNSGF